MPPRRPAIFYYPRRRAMRHLHSRHGPRGGESAGAPSAPHGGASPRGAGRQPLPLHRLHKDFRICHRGLPQGGAGRVSSFVPAYEMEAPRDLSAALERMAREPGTWQLFAGGTDLMVLLEAGKLSHRKFLSIWKLGELRGIEVTPEHVTFGSLT